MNTRKYWIDIMLKIAEPVLSSLAEHKLALELPTYLNEGRSPFRCLEAFGRTICGIAPWLELQDVSGEETESQSRLRRLARKAMDSATDPQSPDFMNFCMGGQPLVDAAFLAHGILRAPRELWGLLDARVKANVIQALKSSRAIQPCETNWLLFAAIVEAALAMMGEEIVEERVDAAVNRFANEWYLGDGTYSDGIYYHFDYYNSFVIHPMYLDVLRAFEKYSDLLPAAEKRAERYAQIQERMISPDGTYTVIGRSVCYRFGAFQLLSQAALEGFLPDELPAARVRCALTAVIEKCVEGGMFDSSGWLIPGVYGYQPELAEGYINVGSLYLCSTVFLALGLPASSPFWSDPDMPWTSKLLWSGERMAADHSVD